MVIDGRIRQVMNGKLLVRKSFLLGARLLRAGAEFDWKALNLGENKVVALIKSGKVVAQQSRIGKRVIEDNKTIEPTLPEVEEVATEDEAEKPKRGRKKKDA